MPITTHSIHDVAARIPGAKRTNDGYRAPCPAHNGKNLNLHVWEQNGAVFLHCHSHKCAWPDLLRAIGLYEERSPLDRNVIDIYDYVDLDGTLRHQTVRYPKTQKPPFRQRRPDPAKPGEYIWNLQGVETVLYRLPQVAKAISEDTIILVLEGERDVHTAERLDFVAACAPMGAGKWRKSYSGQLSGARIAVIPDNDKAGRDHAALVAKELQGYAASVVRVDLPGLAEHGDLTDWVSAGGTREQLEKFIAQAKQVGSKGDNSTSKSWDHIEPLPDFLANRVKMPEGLAHDFLYPGGVTLVAAPSGVGKSVVAHLLARELAMGGVYRGLRLDKARVLLIDTDNPRSLVQDRLSKVCTEHNIDLHISSREKTRPLSDVKYWNDLPADNYDVVVLDSFGGATQGLSEKEGAKYQEAIAVIRNIADRGPALLILDNTVKSAENYRGRGEKAERIDILYECRDVTRWEPQGADWWLNLPDAGDNSWQERASRRRSTPKIRLAFIARKFRWGEEPDPFVLEVSFDTNPWSFEDITEQVEQQAKGASEAQKKEHQLKQMNAVEALVVEIRRRREASDDVISKGDAEELMKAVSGLTRAEIRRLIEAHDANTYPSAGRWRIDPITGPKGRRKGVFALITDGGGGPPHPDNTLKTKELENGRFRHPCAMGSAEPMGFSAVENQGVIDTGGSAELFCDAVRQGGFDHAATDGTDHAAIDVPLKSDGGTDTPDNTMKTKELENGRSRRPGNMGAAEPMGFSAQQNQSVTDVEGLPPSSPNTREEDDIDFMLGYPNYAPPVQKRPDAER